MVRQINWFFFICLLPALFGCGPAAPGPAARWSAMVEATLDYKSVATMTPERPGFISTYDRAGANNDFNNFSGASKEPGWVVIADLKGPGVVDRFWLTGIDFGHPFRFYFDGEKKPRIEGPIEELLGSGNHPFFYPLSQHINQCWWSYVPLTYNKSLRIESLYPPVHRYWGQRRLYVQINHRQLEGPVESFPRSMSSEDGMTLERVAELHAKALSTKMSANLPAEPIGIESGSEAVLYEAGGPGSISGFAVRVEFADSSVSAKEKNALLQDVVLKIYYDDLPGASVNVPLGDFFCNGWRKRNLANFALASTDDGYEWRLPIPFNKSIRISAHNLTDRKLNVFFAPPAIEAAPESPGYLHAIWNKTGPEMKGQPHVLANLTGRGKYVGCYLGVTSMDQSWWILEGDDVINFDGQQFHGTGLEDYFNGGWYYRGSSFSPWNGVLDRYPFRAAQYRFHNNDAISFARNFNMSFERGDQNVSAGFMRSVAYFYLDVPQVVPDASARNDRVAEANPFESYSLMLQLFELERSRDYLACIRMIDEWLDLEQTSEHDGVLRLRQLEYRRLLGEMPASGEYAPFLAGDEGEVAKSQAEQLIWFYEKPNRYLLGAVNNIAGQVLLNGKQVMTRFNPLKLSVEGVELPNGTHTIEVIATPNRVVPWVQVGIRGHRGFAGTGPGTRVTRADGSAEETLSMDVMRGPPHDENYVMAEPNAYVLLQAEAFGVRASNWDAAPDRSRFELMFNTSGMLASPHGKAVVGLPPDY